MRYYLPDFLWSYAFCFSVFFIYPEIKKRGIYITAICVSLYGTLFEILQYINWVNGTGDLVDILLYMAAAFTAVYIKKKFDRRC